MEKVRLMDNFIGEFQPNIEVADMLFDSLKKTDSNWGDTLATVGYLFASIYMSGSENKPKKIELFIAFPECAIESKRSKGYRIIIEQSEDDKKFKVIE